QFFMPVRTYSQGMRARLGFGLSMGIRFDTYLVDEVTAVGDASFNQKSRAVFHDRMKTSSAIMVSHQMGAVRNFCDSGLVLNKGELTYFEDLEEAISRHQFLVESGH
ncbi:MAG: ABC transporter ATP-binding protein, partial [Ascidiaceihabitans sp.]